MKLKQMSKEELEGLSYTDLTYMILKENKQTMNTPTMFKIICDLLHYTEEEYALKIGDYYTSLTLDKRFVLLENAEWDLRENRSVILQVDEDDEEENLDEEETLEEDEEQILDEPNDEDDLDDDDGSLSLNIVDEDDLEDDM